MSIELKTHLERRLRAEVKLYLTDNVSTMISYRWADRRVTIRAHRVFAGADTEIMSALADFVAGRRGPSAERLDSFLEANAGQISRPRRRGMRRVSLNPQGAHHDLEKMFDRLNRRFFDEMVTARIGWGRKRKRKARSRIDFGAYYPEANRIRIHPELDQVRVPAFFVEFIVHHEMCHAYLAGTLFGRDGCHTPEFRQLEKKHPAYEKALAWEEANAWLFFR